MTQKEAIKRLAFWRMRSKCRTSLSVGDETWAAEKYVDLVAGNVRAIASSDIACEWTEADILGEAIRITHATIEALEI